MHLSDARRWGFLNGRARATVRRPARTIATSIVAVAGAVLLVAATPSVARAQIDLVLNLSDAGFDPIPRGGVIKYAVRIDNNGLTTATGVTFTFNVPANASFNGYKGTSLTCGAAVGGVVSCTGPNVGSGGNIKDTMFVNATTQAQITVSGTAGTAGVDVAPGNNTVNEQTTVVAGANVGVSVGAPANAAAGAAIAYAISVSNAGPDAATSLTVQVSLPTGFTQSGALPGGCSIAASTVTCTVAGPINAGGTLNIGNINGQVTAGSGSTLTGAANVQVSAGAPAGTAQDGDNSNNTAAFSTTVTAGSDVQVALSRSPSGSSFGTGTAFTFTITPTYTGDNPTTLTITDVLPGNLTLGALGASQNGWACSSAGQTVTCTKAAGTGTGTNVALGVITIPVTGTVAGTGITNTVTISSAAPNDPNLSNNTASDAAFTISGTGADLSITKTGPSPATAIVGNQISYSVAIQQNGPSPFRGTLIVLDTVPVGMEYVGFNSGNANWACSPAGSSASPQPAGTEISCTRTTFISADFPSGTNTAAVNLVFKVLTSGSLSNCARVTSSGATAADGNVANNRSCFGITTATAPNAADVSLVKTASTLTPAAGDVLTYTLEIVNAGPVAATNVNVADDIGSLINNGVGATGAGYISETITANAAGAGITCSNSANGTGIRRLSCSIPNLPVCTSGVDCPKIDVAVRLGGNGGAVTNSATAQSQSVPDPVSGNNTGSVTVTVQPRADVFVTKTATPSSVAAGQNLVYVVTAGNNGPSAADNVTVTDQLPVGVLFVSATPSSGTCSATPGANVTTTAGNRTVTCNLGTIANTAQGTVTITVRPGTPLRGTTITNNATVSTSTQEPAGSPANNTASANATVTNPTLDLLINKTDSVDPLTVGDNTVYTVTVTNNGPSDAENVTMTDNLPAGGLSFQSAVPASGACATVPAVDAVGGTVVCTLPHLNSGASWTIQVTMKGVAKGIVTNGASVSSDETGLGFENVGNNAATQATTVRSRTDMTVESKVATPGTVGLRKPFTYAIKVKNLVAAGLAEADTVHVTDTFPANMELTGPVTAVVTGTTTLNTCTGAAGATSFDCSFGTVNNGTVIDISVPVRIIGGTGVFANTATVVTSSGDINPANNSNTGNVTVVPSTLNGTVYRDFNNNATIDGTDTGISGITMTLTGTAFDASAVTKTTTTAADGTFSFTGLPQGTYQVARGTVSESFLTVGTQSVGDRGGNAGTVPNISAIALGDQDTGAGYRFAFIPQARVGLAKRALAAPSFNAADNSFTATLRVLAKNYSLETLNTVNLTDVLAGAAPALGTFTAGGAGATLTPGTYTVNTAPSFVAACAGGSVNAAYNGSASTTLASITSLAPSASCEVEFVVRFAPLVPLPGGGYSNQANVSAVGALSGQTPSDPSQDGADPDPDADNNPGNNNVPTPLPVSVIADVTTTLTFPAAVNAGLPVNGTVLFKNNGPFPAATTTFALTLTSGLGTVTFGNLPATATATYNNGTGVVSFTNMPTSLNPNQIASGDGTTGITVSYTQNGAANTTITSNIGTSTNQGANVAPDAATANVVGVPVADVTTALVFPGNVNAGSTVTGTILFKNNGPSTAAGVTYTLTLSTGLTGISFNNLPAGATTSYNSGTGVMTLTGMPVTLTSGQIASGDGTLPITLNYTQPVAPSTTVTSHIGTTTNQGANVAPDDATATITGVPIADVTTSLAFPVTVNAGLPVTGTILFRNTGPSPAANATYTLTLTPNLTGVTFGNLPPGGTMTYVPSTGVVTIAGFPTTLANGQIASGDGTTGITLTYTQPPTATSTITSHIGTSTNQGANVNLDDAVATVGGVPVADVRTIVTLPATIDAGQQVNGTVQFSNQGPSTAAAVTYSIQMTTGLAGVTFGNLPVGATATYASGTGLVTFTGMPTTLTTGQIASGNGTTGITVQYTQPGPATSTVTGTITTTTDQGANIAPDTDTKTVTGNPIADVTTSVSFPSLVPSGSPVSGTILFKNNGPSSAAGMIYTMQLTPGLAGVTFGNLPGGAVPTYNSSTGAVTFAGMPATLTLNQIASGNGTTGITLSYTQPAAGVSNIASHIGTSTNQGANVAPDDASATVLGEADVTTALAFPLKVDAGGTVTGTVLYKNNGPSTGNGMSYTLQLNTGLFGVSFSNLPVGATASYNSATGAVTFTGFPASLVSGQIASGTGVAGITLSYQQPANPTSTVTSHIGTSTSQGANVAPDDATTTITGGFTADLSVVKTANVAQTTNGGAIVYTIRVTNAGPSNMPGGATLTDAPAGVTLQTVTCSGAAGNQCLSAPTVASLTGAGATLPQLQVNAFYELTVTALVTQASGSVVNTTTVTTPPGTTDPTPGNNTSTVTTPIIAGPNLSITKTAVGSSFVPGGPASFNIAVVNGGAGPTTGPVTVVDVLPSTLTFVSAAGAGWTCTAAGQTVTCVSSAVIAPAGSASVIALAVTIAPTATGSIANTATVSTPGDLPGGSKTGTATIQVGGINLGVTKTIATDTLHANTITSYTVNVTNSGTVATTGLITMTDNLPAGITPTSASGSGFTCTISSQTVTCTRTTPALAPGQSVPITINVNVGSTITSGPVSNTACVTTPGDILAANDCGTVSTPVGGGGKNPFTIKKDTVGGYVIGQPGLFKFTLKTTSTSQTGGAAYIIDSLPAGMTYKGFTGTGWTCGQGTVPAIVICKNPNPAAFASDPTAVLTLITELSAAAKGAFGNCAVIVTDDAPLAGPDKKSCVFGTAHVDYRLALTLTTPKYVLQVGDSPDFTVHVKNIGGSPLPDVMLTNILPNGFTYVPGSSRRGGDPARNLSVANANALRSTKADVASLKIADPSGGQGPAITWPLGGMNPGDDVIIIYKAKIHVGASFNTDNITQAHAVSEAGALSVESNADQVPIRLERGLFDDHGVIAGKVYMHCNCTGDTTQTAVDLGIPGVRLYMEDGSSVITDVEGKYDFTAVRSGLHVVKVDRTTLPAGASFFVLDNRNAEDPYSRFVDLKSGELARADFADGSRSTDVFNEVLARRRKGEVNQPGDMLNATQMTLSNAPVMRPAAEAIPATGSYVPLAPPSISNDGRPSLLTSGNSNLPVTPQTANARLTGLPLAAHQGQVQIHVPTGGIPADGRTITPIHVVVLDTTGKQLTGTTVLTLETTAGGWVTPDADKVNLGLQVTLTNGEGTFNLMAAREPVVAQLRAQTAIASTTVSVNFITAPRPLIAAGLFQGRLDLRSVSRGGLDLAAVGDGFETRLTDLSISSDSGKRQASARAAFFVKGEVESLGQLTLRYDSQNDRLLGEFRDIQPDNYFPIYGDAAIREFDAQSSQRLYARIDRGTSFLRYGDFTTNRSDDRRMLLAYNRSLTGLLSHTEGEYGVVNAYVSQGRATLQVDELPGRGLSGPYTISKLGAIQNSERVEIVTRDRNQPAIIIRSQTLTRFEEYTLDPATGALTFKSPVPSMDENLNPMSIRVSYEMNQLGGDSFLTYGADAVLRLGTMELGGFVAKDANPIDKQLLAGGSITAKITDGTLVMGEFAHTDNDTDAGTGNAWRLELRHQSAKLEGRVYGIQSDSTYLNQSSTFAGGRKEYGARLAATVTADSRIIAEALHTEDIRTTGNRDGASLAWEQRLSQMFIGEVGYRYADESKVPVQFQTTGITPISLNSLHARLTAVLPNRKSSVFGEVEKSLDDDAHRMTVGGEYMLFDHTRMYGRQEWISAFAGPYALNDRQYQMNTVFGIDANVLKNSQVFSEYRLRDAIAGRDAEASYGLRNRWALGQGVLANTSFERVSTIVGSGLGRAWAVTGGLELTQSPLWKASTRLEWRNTSAGDEFLGSGAYARKLSRDWTTIARTLWQRSATDELRARSQIGLAWRQTDENTTNALFRIEQHIDNTLTGTGEMDKANAWLAALLVNTQPSQHLTLSGRYAGKLAHDDRDGADISNTAQLFMGRVIYDVSRKLDVGVIGSVLGDGGFGSKSYGTGAELGYLVIRNLRVAGGYNLFGFSDKDFSALGYTQKGPYLEFGFKFDESMLGVGSKPQDGRKP